MIKRNTGAWLAATALGALLPLGSAVAADLPVKAKPIIAATFDWSGIYIGAHAGYGGGMKNWEDLGGAFVARGPLVGGQIGINKQLGSLVIGVELEGSWADITGAQRLAIGGTGFGPASFLLVQNDRSRIDGIGMLTGRAGLAADRWFVFAKAGLAVLHEKHDLNVAVTAGQQNGVTTASWDDTRYAPVVGFGTEYALASNWSLKGEYNLIYADAKSRTTIGTGNINGVVTNGPLDIRAEQAIHLVKLGVNYRWGVVAPDPSFPPVPAAPGTNWSGGYVGVQGGYGWGSKAWPAANGIAGQFEKASYDVGGWLGGGTIGVNAQAGSFVFGVEGEILGSGIGGSVATTAALQGTTVNSTYNSKIDWLALTTARAGFVVGSNLLLYGKAGVAIAQETHNLTNAFIIPGQGAVTTTLTGKPVHTGLVAGFGGEYAFMPNWSVKLEYDYVRMAQQSVAGIGTGVINAPPVVGTIENAQLFNKVRQELHLVKFGVNYHFNPLPVVVAKY